LTFDNNYLVSCLKRSIIQAIHVDRRDHILQGPSFRVSEFLRNLVREKVLPNQKQRYTPICSIGNKDVWCDAGILSNQAEKILDKDSYEKLLFCCQLAQKELDMDNDFGLKSDLYDSGVCIKTASVALEECESIVTESSDLIKNLLLIMEKFHE
jgi:hypothetical protein